MRKYKLRFNLGKGERFMKWKITYPDGSVDYLDPDEVTIVLWNCQLKNRRKVAEAIFEGANKRVCSWVTAEKAMVFTKDKTLPPIAAEPIRYNPRLAPHWTDSIGADIDDVELTKVITDGRRLFAQK